MARFTKETGKIAGSKSSNKGQKQKKTIVKEILGLNNIEQLKPDVLKVWKKLISSGKADDYKFASKEISKYVFPTKRESVIDLTAKATVHIYTVKPCDNDD